MTTSTQTNAPDTGLHTCIQPKPEWAKRSPTPCRYWSDEDSGEDGFWYDTKEDFRNGLSYFGDPRSMLSPDFQNKTFSLPPYGNLVTSVIDGQGWGLLGDLSRIVGIPTSEITGYIPYGSVRGEPGYLNPDGIRYLDLQNIIGRGIRLEAIIPTLMKGRDGKRFTGWLLNTVIPDVYADFPAMADSARELVSSTEAVVSDLLASPARSSRVDETRFYNDCYGEFRAVVIGSRLWFRLHDIAAYLSVSLETILLLLGNDRVIEVAKMGDHDSNYIPGVETQYVEYGTFRRLLKLSLMGTSHLDTITPWVFRAIKIVAIHGRVSAGALHRMLGRHQTFDAWAWETNRKHGYALSRLEDNHHPKLKQDLRVPLELALKVALKEQCFAGAITYCLLADGGYLHGGPWNESADDCLKRFYKLIPDRQGRVDRLKLKEFLEPRGSTSNHFDIDEGSETWMTLQDAWHILGGTFGRTIKSLRKFGAKRVTENFAPIPPPLSECSEET